jgi:hypothetical protein
MALLKEKILTMPFGTVLITTHKTMSDKEHETTRIYTGPAMLVKGLVARLNELGISPIERNDNESSIQAGFTIGIPGQVMLYIRKDELPIAQSTIDEYLEEIGE